jgi:hypothetical protein
MDPKDPRYASAKALLKSFRDHEFTELEDGWETMSRSRKHTLDTINGQ